MDIRLWIEIYLNLKIMRRKIRGMLINYHLEHQNALVFMAVLLSNMHI